MSGRPRVSVVMPCYNAEKFLSETLASLTTQTFRDFEVVAVNDGSTDRTGEILAASSVPLRILSGPNRGLTHARNWATAESSGEYLQYLDADDLLLPQALESRVRALDAGGDVAYGDWQFLDETADGSFRLGGIRSQRIEDINPDIESATFSGFWVPPAGVMYRRSVVEAAGGSSRTLTRIQDARMLHDAANQGVRFVHVPGVSVHFRLARAPSFSRSSPDAFLKDIFLNATEVEKRWRAQQRLTTERHRALASAYAYVAYERFLAGEGAQAGEAWRALARVQPGFRWSKAKVSWVLTGLLGLPLARRVLLTALNLRARWRGQP